MFYGRGCGLAGTRKGKLQAHVFNSCYSKKKNSQPVESTGDSGHNVMCTRQLVTVVSPTSISKSFALFNMLSQFLCRNTHRGRKEDA